MSLELYKKVTFKTSALTTKSYSTSFYLATTLLETNVRNAIYGIYGFVRYADEVVDTFHQFDKQELLDEFERDYYLGLERGLSLNPILHSFQSVVSQYHIKDAYVQSFLKSMKADLQQVNFTEKSQIDNYIYGSADVVGLMCLSVFCNGDQKLFDELKTSAMHLGSAFQKVNFLRDLKNDTVDLGRNYFPNITKTNLNEYSKKLIINEIEKDFEIALDGIKRLPASSKTAVLLAYLYYKTLLKKLKRTPANEIIKRRIRISNFTKLLLIKKAVIFNRIGLF
jgi:phytoene/squalene synthetase